MTRIDTGTAHERKKTSTHQTKRYASKSTNAEFTLQECLFEKVIFPKNLLQRLFPQDICSKHQIEQA